MYATHSYFASESALADTVYGLQVRVPCACENAQVSVVSAVLDEIIGTKQVRKGPRPDEMSVRAMSDVIDKYVRLGLPIPFMCPWGSEKPDGGMIDIAELCAIRTIQCLDQRVREHYAPGIVCHIRVEDVSAPHLFFERADAARKEAKLYSDAFELLVEVLGCSNCIKIKRESARTSEETFNRTADVILPFMEEHINHPDSASALADLKAIGWKSPVSREMASEYLERYERLYPDKNLAERRHVLARYFSGVLARIKLDLRGDDRSWNGSFLDLSFVEPARTVGSLFPRRVYYRTIPASVSSNHMPPWRAKGHMVIESGSVRPRVASFHEKLNLNPAIVTLRRNTSSVVLRCDWQSL